MALNYEEITRFDEHRRYAEQKLGLYEQIRAVCVEISSYIHSGCKDKSRWKALVLKKEWLQAEIAHCKEHLDALDAQIVAQIHTLRTYIVE